MKAHMIIEFDRPVIEDYHYIMLGGYEVVAAGKSYQFDFLDTYGCIDHMHPKCVVFQEGTADLESFPEMVELKKHLHEITAVNEFFVYTGENTDPEINPVMVRNFLIETLDEEGIIPETETDFIITKRCGDFVCCFFKNPIDLRRKANEN